MTNKILLALTGLILLATFYGLYAYIHAPRTPQPSPTPQATMLPKTQNITEEQKQAAWKNFKTAKEYSCKPAKVPAATVALRFSKVMMQDTTNATTTVGSQEVYECMEELFVY